MNPFTEALKILRKIVTANIFLLQGYICILEFKPCHGYYICTPKSTSLYISMN